MARFALNIPRNVLTRTNAVIHVEADSLDEARALARAQQAWELGWTKGRLEEETPEAWAEPLPVQSREALAA